MDESCGWFPQLDRIKRPPRACIGLQSLRFAAAGGDGEHAWRVHPGGAEPTAATQESNTRVAPRNCSPTRPNFGGGKRNSSSRIFRFKGLAHHQTVFRSLVLLGNRSSIAWAR